MDNKKNNLEKNNQEDVKKEEIEREIDLSKYKDREGGSLRSLNFGLWFVKNRRNFILALILILIFLSVVLYSRVFYNIYSFIKNRPEELRILRELSTITVNFGAARSAESVNVGTPQSFFHNNKYDFVNRVENPNDNFIAFVNYCFFSGETEIACDRSSVFPEEHKYLMILSVESETLVNNLKFVVKNVNWQRVDSKRYGNWRDYYQERVNFLISDENFESSYGSQNGAVNSNNLSFKITNQSPYNYWEIPLSIILFNQDNIVGVNRYMVYELMSLEEENINLSWANSVSSVSRVEIIPELDILAEDNYIRYK